MEFNSKQKMVLYIVIVIIVIMFLFPPWRSVGDIHYNWGYKPFLTNDPYGEVNILRLIVQWIGTLIIGGIAFLLVADKKKK
ncbi:MAG: hypothetical protein JW976_15725 [Syntrophaceae bacterium]|nr:hypothetical protein [Syntrophaceae bacterium]